MWNMLPTPSTCLTTTISTHCNYPLHRASTILGYDTQPLKWSPDTWCKSSWNSPFPVALQLQGASLMLPINYTPGWRSFDIGVFWSTNRFPFWNQLNLSRNVKPKTCKIYEAITICDILGNAHSWFLILASCQPGCNLRRRGGGE